MGVGAAMALALPRSLAVQPDPLYRGEMGVREMVPF